MRGIFREMRKYFLGILAITLFDGCYAFNLVEVYRKSLVHNATYLEELAKSDAKLEQPKIIGAQLLPQITFNGSLSGDYYQQNELNETFWATQSTFGVSLTQVLVDFSKFSAYTKSKYEAEVAHLQAQNARQKLILQVVKQYFEVLYAQDSLLATQMKKAQLKEQIRRTKRAFELGAVNIVDVNDEQAAYDVAVAEEIQDQNNLLNQKKIFANLTGANPEQVQPLAENIHLASPNPESVELWAELAKKNNLDIKTAQKELYMAREEIKIAKSGHLPTLNLTAGLSYTDVGNILTNISSADLAQVQNDPQGPLSTYTNGSIMLTLAIPIYSGGLISAQSRKAMALYDASYQQLHYTQREIDQQVRNAYWQTENGVKLVQAKKEALKSAKTQMNSAELGYKVGIRDSLELVKIQTSYYQAFKDYQRSRYDYLIAQLNLKSLSDAITDKFLELINANIKN